MTLAGSAVRLVQRCGRACPPAFAAWVGGVLGWAVGGLPGREQSRARAHLARAYPAASPAWIRRTARAGFRHFGRMALWNLVTLGRPVRHLARGLIVKGREHLRASIARTRAGQGVVICSGHLGNWELLARCTTLVLPCSIIGRRLRDPDLDQLVRDLRRGEGSQVIYQDEGARPALRALRDGRVLATLPDQDVPRLTSILVPWYGIPAATPSGPAQLALLSRCPLQTVTCHWQAGRWVMCWGPLRTWTSTGDREADTAAATAWISASFEARVRRHPEQWVWWHKRWRQADIAQAEPARPAS